MKIVREFTVEIDGAKFLFKKPTRKDVLEWGNASDKIEWIFSRLIRVDGLTDENDAPVTEIRTMDLPADIVARIASEFSSQFVSLMGIDTEKKSSTTT